MEKSSTTTKKTILLVKNRENEHHQWIVHIQISLSTNFQLIFKTKFVQKGYFQSKINTEKINTTIDYRDFAYVESGILHMVNTICEYHPSMVNTTIEFCIFQLILVPNFSFKWQFLNQIYPKRIFPVENRKIALLHASMAVTYYVQLFRTMVERQNSILMSLLLLVAEAIIMATFNVREFWKIR